MQQGKVEVKPAPAKVTDADGFFVSCSGMELWQLAMEISDYFGVNILVFDDIKEKKVYGDIKGVDLKHVLDSISWYLGCEYVEKDGIFYVGSNSKSILVLPSSGLAKEIEGVFKDVTLKLINDKIIVYGTERDVAKVQGVYNDLTKQRFCVVRMYAVEVQYDKGIELGIDLEKSVKYAFSWENMLENSYNPVQSLAVSLYASLEADADSLRVSSLIDTDLGLLSGVAVTVQVGTDQDRPVYTQSDYGDRVISSYSTQKTGLLLELKGSWDNDDWIIDFNVENSEAKSDLVKTVTMLTTKARLSKENPVHLLCKLNLSSLKESYDRGVPLLADIPYLGYLFRVSSDREMCRQIFFVIAFQGSEDTSLPAGSKPPPLLSKPSVLLETGKTLSTVIPGL